MIRVLRSFAATTVLLVVVFGASTALAAPAPWQRVDVILHAEQSGGVMLISGELPTGTKLPAEAELSVPAGSTLLWIGEILGGATSADPSLTFTTATVGASDVYRFTLTKALKAQVEVEAATPMALEDGSLSSSLKWTSLTAVPEVGMSIRVPAGAQVVTGTPGATLETGDAGSAYFTKIAKKVKAGAKLDLSFTYTVSAVAPVAAATPAGGSDTGTILIVLALVLVLAIVIIVAVWAKMRSRAVPDDETDTDDSPAFATDEAPSRDAGHAATRPSGTGRTAKILVTTIVVGVLLVFVVIVAVYSTRPQVSGDTISRTFATGEACATTEFSLAVPAGADAVATAEAIFTALKAVPGMNNATYNAKTSSISVGYCGSEASEAEVRAAMQPTGFVAQ
jgi:hypothetical protein